MTADHAERKIKCVVWDLDHTLWQGVLLEDPHVALAPHAAEVVRTLDARGILQSVASRNDRAIAMARLDELGLADYMLHPQIGWQTKAQSIKAIAAALNIGLDTLAFVDDDPFERADVAYSHPEVLCIDARALPTLLDMPAMQPRFITDDSARRRAIYRSDIARQQAEETFTGSKDDFLATLGMVFTLARATEDDLRRAEELTLRTNQLNTTGDTYSYEELQAMLGSDRYLLLIASLTDTYGDYGKIGLAIVDRQPGVWTIRLLLMSCRVMSRGVGTIMLNYILRQARAAGVRLRSEFVETSKNRMMYVTYRFAGFRELSKDGARSVLENDLERIQDPPTYLVLHAPELSR